MEQDRVISQGQGDLLDADVEALVNTVNTVGVMGKGIALQFKRAFPEMFKAYERAAKSGQLQLGRMHVWETGLMQGPPRRAVRAGRRTSPAQMRDAGPKPNRTKGRAALIEMLGRYSDIALGATP